MSSRRAIAQNILDRLVAAERTNDLAIVDTAELAATLLKARLELEAAVGLGHEVFEQGLGVDYRALRWKAVGSLSLPILSSRN